MRFHSDGPSIPKALIEARDRGEVIFFCGAGISMSAGLPDFSGLVANIIEHLNVADDDRARLLFQRIQEAISRRDFDFIPSMDRVIGMLQYTFGRGQVDEAVAKCLRIPRGASVENHQTVLKLSTDPNGICRLVTTNFDLLFERARRGLKFYTPPKFPRLDDGDPLDGLVYLHGRLAASRLPQELPNLVVGSSDYGRAYLSDGWALTFLRALLTKFTVVLIGYSADDPPINYLLQGLHSQIGQSGKLYAFTEHLPGETDTRWIARGVQDIPYTKNDPMHSGLWDSLNSWADEASDRAGWRNSTISLARTSPSALLPHERGLVTFLVESVDGAKAFADTEPPMPPEWLCVLDPGVRFGKPFKEAREHGLVQVDPHEVYRLDDDPLREELDQKQGELIPADILAASPLDQRRTVPLRLSGQFREPLPMRLGHLVRWISKISNHPTTAWWASGTSSLHYWARYDIQRELSAGKLEYSPAIRQFWQLYFEATEQSFLPDLSTRREFDTFAKRDGWTNAACRSFSLAVRPTLSIRRPIRTLARPPGNLPEEYRLADLADIDVEFHSDFSALNNVPPNALPRIVEALRLGLTHGASLLDDLDERWWRAPSIVAENKPGERHVDDMGAHFLQFAHQFSILARKNPRRAKEELERWPSDDEYFFKKLRIWSLSFPSIASGSETGAAILALTNHEFWHREDQRELLFTIRRRWKSIPSGMRRQIENRILAGSPKLRREGRIAGSQRSMLRAAERLGWLKREGCELSRTALLDLQKIRRQLPAGIRYSADQAASSLDGRGGFVRVVSDPTKIVGVSDDQIVEVAKKFSKKNTETLTDHAPFKGLVESNPTRSIAALEFAADRTEYPLKFWQTLLGDWPTQAPLSAARRVCKAIKSMPANHVMDLRHYIPGWLERNLRVVARKWPSDGWASWDHVFEVLAANGVKGTESGIGEISHGSQSVRRSRKGLDYAINGPIGHLTEALLRVLSTLKPAANSKFPQDIIGRIEKALSAPGEGRDHAVAILCRNLRWLFFVDPSWTRRQLIPMLDLTHEESESAWNGFLHDTLLPSADLFDLLKLNFLKVIETANDLQWPDNVTRRSAEFLVLATKWNFDSKGRHYVNLAEARAVLRKTNDSCRAAALYMLSTYVKDAKTWKEFGRIFLQKAWPTELWLQTGHSSDLLTQIAIQASSAFPDAVRVVLPLLVPGGRDNLTIYRFKKESESSKASITERYPSEAIDIIDRLIANSPVEVPYGLSDVLSVAVVKNPKLANSKKYRRLQNLTAID